MGRYNTRSVSTRRKILAASGAAGIGSLAGCLGFLIADTDGEVQMESAAEVTVGAGRENAFSPQLVHIEEGGSVTFTWQSGNHDVTSFHLENDVPLGAPEGSIPFSQDLQGPGEELTVDINEPGVYNVLCVRHERVGMMMSVIVGEPEDLDNEPALDDPDPALSDDTQNLWNQLADEVRELIG